MPAQLVACTEVRQPLGWRGCRFKVAIADLVPGEESDIWVELEHSDHKKHIRNHSEFHEDLNARKKSNADMDKHPQQQQQQQHSRDNLESDPDVPVESSPFVGITGPQPQEHLSGAMHQDGHRDAFRPLHARQSRYAADNSLLQSPAETPIQGNTSWKSNQCISPVLSQCP